MSGIKGYEPDRGPWDDLLWQDEFKPKPGYTLADAIERLAEWEGRERSQLVAMEYLRTGIWSATCQRAFSRMGPHKYIEPSDFQKALSALDLSVGKLRRKAAYGPSYVNSRFWHKVLGKAGEEWEIEGGFAWPDAARIHRERGLVEAFHGFFREDLEGEDEFFAVRLTLFGVEVSEDDVEATAPVRGTLLSAATRKTVYDWEAAFADVAASFYHDTEFERLEARGVQKQIVDLLRFSFEKRGLAVPSDDTLKPKARLMLGALRDKKP